MPPLDPIFAFLHSRILAFSHSRILAFLTFSHFSILPYLCTKSKTNHMQLLQNKTALVTGAGSGIGRSIARAYARNGAKVVIADIDETGGNDTVEMIRQEKGTAFFVKTDVSRPADNERMVAAAVEQFGALHIACNNAGIVGELARVGKYPIESWDRVIAINLSGAFYGMRYQLPALQQSGGGAIVNIASVLGQAGGDGLSAYTAAKHGLVGLTKSAALEYAQRNIRINAVGPGYIDTPMLHQNLPAEQHPIIRQMHPIGRLGRPEEVAELVLWLSSEKASFVTGAYYSIDGGFLAR